MQAVYVSIPCFAVNCRTQTNTVSSHGTWHAALRNTELRLNHSHMYVYAPAVAPLLSGVSSARFFLLAWAVLGPPKFKQSEVSNSGATAGLRSTERHRICSTLYGLVHASPLHVRASSISRPEASRV